MSRWGAIRGWRRLGYRERMKRVSDSRMPVPGRAAYAKGCSRETFVRLLADDARRIVDVT